MLTVYPIRLRFIFGSLLASAPHMCKSTLFNSYFFSCLLRRTAAFCLLLLYSNKMQHRAFCLYLFVFPVQSQQCFSSRRRLLLFFLKDKKDTASIAVRKYPSLYMYASPHTAVTGYGETDYIRFFNAVYKKYMNTPI